MACATCGHTMQLVQQDTDGRPTHWCPQCGSLTVGAGMPAVPRLVERCREFQLQMSVGTGLGSQYASKPLWALWRRLGIAESIDKPADRPK
jgi:DNA-directed RNA polymerase subunit RPC12/RpoP